MGASQPPRESPEPACEDKAAPSLRPARQAHVLGQGLGVGAEAE